jgi:hypothetical protein
MVELQGVRVAFNEIVAPLEPTNLIAVRAHVASSSGIGRPRECAGGV